MERVSDGFMAERLSTVLRQWNFTLMRKPNRSRVMTLAKNEIAFSNEIAQIWYNGLPFTHRRGRCEAHISLSQLEMPSGGLEVSGEPIISIDISLNDPAFRAVPRMIVQDYFLPPAPNSRL
jgi:hypothetical protein